jgi:hypothetical protein
MFRNHIRNLFDFSNGELNQKVLQPLGKPEVLFACAGLLLICGMVGRKQVENATPLPTNYSIAATLPIFLKRFTFVIRIIAEAKRGFSSG